MEAPISVSLGAMSSLLGKLDYLLTSQHLFRKPVRKDIELLKEDLERIKTFLLELSNEDDLNQTKKYWMKEVREVSYDIEDYIDRVIYSQAKIGSVGVVPRLKIRKLPRTLNQRPKIANQIQGLRARLEDAGERHNRYVIGNNTPSSYSNIPYGRSIAALREEASRLLVGIDDSREKLIKLLNDGEKQLKVITVFGIGGIGKTTLVKQLFEDHAGQFGFRAFVRVSRKPDTRSVLRSIISQTRCHHPFDACNVQDLIACLNKHLENKSYLIVIDDLWDTTVWDILLGAFSNGSHSSRIIATTAIKNVAMACCGDKSDYVLMMEPLNIDDSRKLFFTRVFGSEDKCPQQFKDASYEIIRKCGGVPLAIINIAGFVASQPDKRDLWDYAQKSLCSNIGICPTTEGIVNAINLGYNGLPHCLKTCLQYVTMYPENCTIWKDDLVRRWIAEGFISPKEGNDMEAIAERYFEELVYRGMIQPIDTIYKYKVFSCTVHNLVLDLLTNKSTEDNFISKIDYSQNSRVLSNKVRRLLLFFSTAKYASKPSDVTLSQVRSLAFYGLIKCMPSVREFEFLRVLFLHFSGDYCGHTPFNLAGICRLFQLRYLKVTCNFSLQLPTHIEGLYHLETLELDARVTPLPEDIVYLQHLLHLRLPSGTNLPDKIGRMRSLRTLKYFDLCSNSENKIRVLEELINLQELELTCTTVPSDSLDTNLNVLCSILGSFSNIKSIALHPGYSVTCSSTSVIDSTSTSSPPVCLENFEMHPAICIFSGFPEWMRSLGRLCILKIGVSEFLQHDMDSLGGLPVLRVLSLYVRRPTIGQIVFNSGAFPSLKCFKFRCALLNLAFLEETMPNLRRLKVCFKSDRGLIMVAGIMHLLNLREVAVRIGLPTGECNRQAQESAFAEQFKVAIGEHKRIPNTNVKYVNWDDEHDDTKNKSDSRISKSADTTISSSDLLKSDVACKLARGNKVHSTKSEKDTVTNVVNMVSVTEGTIHEMQKISDKSSYTSVEIDQAFKDAELEHKAPSQKQGKLQCEEHDAVSHARVRVTVAEFSYREIKEATNNFDDSRKIGEGGFGTVYRGHLRYTDVAIKIFRPVVGRTREDGFNQEVQALSRIKHPNLITLIGVCPEAKAAIYEFFPNGSLKDHLERSNKTKPLPWRTRIGITADICRALLFLHSYKPEGIVHGNLNPGNVYLDDNYVAKLGYFLLKPSPWTQDWLRNNFRYMDPMYDNKRALTAESDVYSFGRVLMRLLNVDKSSIRLRMFTAKSDAPAGDYFVTPEYAERLKSLADRCCRYDRKERPDLAGEVWPVLRSMLKEVSTPLQLQDNKWATPPLFIPTGEVSPLQFPDNKWGASPQIIPTGGIMLSSGKKKMSAEDKKQWRQWESSRNIETEQGSKDESFFEARPPWLDYDSEDDFYSVGGDFTPS